MRVGIVGCGVAGQAAAAFLSEAGHDVTIYERFAEPRPLGAGLLLQPTGLAVLRELGLEEQAQALGAKVVGLEAKTHRGRSVLDLSYADLHPAAHGLGIRRSVLFDLLHGRLKRSPAAAQPCRGPRLSGRDRVSRKCRSAAGRGPSRRP